MRDRVLGYSVSYSKVPSFLYLQQINMMIDLCIDMILTTYPNDFEPEADDMILFMVDIMIFLDHLIY